MTVRLVLSCFFGCCGTSEDESLFFGRQRFLPHLRHSPPESSLSVLAVSEQTDQLLSWDSSSALLAWRCAAVMDMSFLERDIPACIPFLAVQGAVLAPAVKVDPKDQRTDEVA
ncbi:hypothetical protein HPB47_001275 [Ixodes persulcatus]|uniref:Uncharacterized protein n=1 Tax=Ixodes persulcatus TaxID=34615 RepID=A0AC60PPG8_IXOPE|nr:hypothetical protein HPB47_001275 [Ixodes persulcatus]